MQIHSFPKRQKVGCLIKHFVSWNKRFHIVVASKFSIPFSTLHCTVLLFSHTYTLHKKRITGTIPAQIYILHKGQLISEWNFGAFKSPKKPTKFLADFCPSLVEMKSSKPGNFGWCFSCYWVSFYNFANMPIFQRKIG